MERDYALAKEIKGFNGYMVTPSGAILSLPRGITNYTKNGKPTIHRLKKTKQLKPTSNGYHLRVELSFGGKQKTVFVKNLVAEAFVPKPAGIVKPTAILKDGNANNTHYSNIEWVSYTWACRGKVQNK